MAEEHTINHINDAYRQGEWIYSKLSQSHFMDTSHKACCGYEVKLYHMKPGIRVLCAHLCGLYAQIYQNLTGLIIVIIIIIIIIQKMWLLSSHIFRMVPEIPPGVCSVCLQGDNDSNEGSFQRQLSGARSFVMLLSTEASRRIFAA